jgi:CRP-like cAMP-binding protein
VQKHKIINNPRVAGRAKAPPPDLTSGRDILSAPLAGPQGQKLVQKISSSASKMSYEKGHIFFAQGEKPRGVFLLLEGSAKLSITSPEGNGLMVGFFGPGAVLGLAANILDRAHETSAEAMTRCMAVPLARDAFLGIANGNAETVLEIAAMLGEESFKLTDLARIIGLSDSASQRLAALLLKLREANGCKNGTPIELGGITENDFGQMVGLCRETVSRLLSRLSEKGVLHWQRPTLVVQDWNVLENMAMPSEMPGKKRRRSTATLKP